MAGGRIVGTNTRKGKGFMNTYSGSCHCQAVQFEVDWDPTEPLIDCNCSICTKKGILHMIVPPERFRLQSGEPTLVEYRFNTGEAVHRFCGICGIHPFYSPRSHPGHVDVNARCLTDFEADAFTIEAFDGRNWEENVDTIR